MATGDKIGFKQINALAIPSIIAGISEPLLSVVDTAIVGNVKVNSIEALAAVGIAGSFISAIIWVIGQSKAAISAVIAQYVGSKTLNKIQEVPAQMISINVGLSVALYLLTLLFTQQIFVWYNADGLILDYAVSYYKIRAVGLPFSLFVFTVYGVFAGLQNTFWPMVISTIGLVLNIVFDVLFVYGYQDIIPAMHVEGAAYASVLAQGVMALIALFLYLKKTPFKLISTKSFHPEIKRLIGLSVNLFVRALALHIALILANSYATGYGKTYIAAQTICFQVWLFFSFFVDGYASVGSIVSGKLKGAGSTAHLKKLVVDLTKYAVIVAFVLMCVCFLFYNEIGVLFTDDSEVLSVFYAVFWMVLVSQPLNAVAFVYDGVFKGLAEVVVLRNTVVAATFLGFVPALLIADYFDLKLMAIWTAFSVWMCYRSGILHIYFRKNLSKMLNR